jgi:hypothetical protein
MRTAFSDHVLVEPPDAKHYIQEDAPERITRRSSTASAEPAPGKVAECATRAR